MSSLVDTSLYFSHYLRYSSGKYRELRLLLEKLSCSPYFMPCDLCIQVLTMWELTNQPYPSFAWKHVTLQMHLRKQYLPDICSLLRNSHFLETLAIYVYPGRYGDESEGGSLHLSSMALVTGLQSTAYFPASSTSLSMLRYMVMYRSLKSLSSLNFYLRMHRSWRK
ncbi:uncharacterized protein LOC115674505 isoform X2 [Syzygium oleosum]|uniref:uncharacterized protein LOC115674505 isoform X2 n=1 Tax=Syzygium oleosum TaxID=219896 RepID=UPI0024B8A38A|nr:uncharacterized protein LOC115674505 isoform X2 [Syzygium oleosum]